MSDVNRSMQTMSNSQLKRDFMVLVTYFRTSSVQRRPRQFRKFCFRELFEMDIKIRNKERNILVVIFFEISLVLETYSRWTCCVAADLLDVILLPPLYKFPCTLQTQCGHYISVFPNFSSCIVFDVLLKHICINDSVSKNHPVRLYTSNLISVSTQSFTLCSGCDSQLAHYQNCLMVNVVILDTFQPKVNITVEDYVNVPRAISSQRLLSSLTVVK